MTKKRSSQGVIIILVHLEDTPDLHSSLTQTTWPGCLLSASTPGLWWRRCAGLSPPCHHHLPQGELYHCKHHHQHLPGHHTLQGVGDHHSPATTEQNQWKQRELWWSRPAAAAAAVHLAFLLGRESWDGEVVWSGTDVVLWGILPRYSWRQQVVRDYWSGDLTTQHNTTFSLLISQLNFQRAISFPSKRRCKKRKT